MSIIDKPSDYFNTVLYTGTGATQSISGLNFQPDFTWIKGRSGATDHALYDAVRGTTKDMASNTLDAETTQATGLTAFSTDGFTVGALAKLNTSSATYSSWNWLGANGTASNGNGSIDSTVSANTTSGFSIVSYSGNSTSGATVGHGLGVTPSMIIVKRRTAGEQWEVYHKTLGATKRMALDTTGASSASSSRWNNTEPTTSVFSLGNSGATNTSGSTYIAYCFADVQGYSKFGSYTGNGNVDGTFIYTGFKPAFVMYKSSSGAYNWIMQDNKRANPFNEINADVRANVSDAEATSTSYNDVDFLSNGIKLREDNNDQNGSGGTYIYMAFAEAPLVGTNNVPCTAR